MATYGSRSVHLTCGHIFSEVAKSCSVSKLTVLRFNKFREWNESQVEFWQPKLNEKDKKFGKQKIISRYISLPWNRTPLVLV